MFPFHRMMERLQPYRHQAPVIVAVEPDPEPERLRWWEAAVQPAAEAGAALVILTSTPVTLRNAVCFVDPGLSPSALASSKAWILDAYLEPRACLDAARLDPDLLGRILAWVEGIQHECPE
ncbi:hypothetical protein [Thermoflexus sp.]|uniref:hypothetical protein n=1 Tax=Thermoflexus sp. TaxID=1969742 RepID=UPI002ADDB3CC|nr:hypothetical protein [Thermoflexus sp.]